MKEILANLALLDLTTFCRDNKIDCSGSHLYKYPRRFTYTLVRDKDGRSLVSVTYYKNSAPLHFITPK